MTYEIGKIASSVGRTADRHAGEARAFAEHADQLARLVSGYASGEDHHPGDVEAALHVLCEELFTAPMVDTPDVWTVVEQTEDPLCYAMIAAHARASIALGKRVRAHGLAELAGCHIRTVRRADGDTLTTGRGGRLDGGGSRTFTAADARRFLAARGVEQ